MLADSDFSALFKNARTSVFRLQTLDRYDVPEEREEFAAFLREESIPDRSHDPWLETIHSSVARGCTWMNVHVIPETLTPYLRYLTGWWYPFWKEVGADVRFLPRENLNKKFDQNVQDFWLFDDVILVRMHYDADGRFVGAERSDDMKAVKQAVQTKAWAIEQSSPLL